MNITASSKLTLVIECVTQQEIDTLYLLGNCSGVKRDGIREGASTTVPKLIFDSVLDALYTATEKHATKR